MTIAKIVKKVEKFVASPHGEVIGAAMLSLPQNIRADEIMPLFARHGIKDIDPNAWYKQQTILDVYRDIEEGHSTVTERLIAIGTKSVDTMPVPPEVNTLEAMISFMGSTYAGVHRNIWEGEGTYIQFLGTGHAHVIFNTPYPDDIFYGYYWGIMARAIPKGKRFHLQYIENTHADTPGTVLEIKW